MFAGYLLLPIVAALPQPKFSLPELSLNQWSEIQEGFTTLSSWSFNKASEIVNQGSGDDDTQDTIWKKLKDDPHSFSKLVKLINFVGDGAIKVLDDKDAQITFFAPNNDALTPPEHHHHDHHHHDHDKELQDFVDTPSLASAATILDAQPAYLLEDEGGDKDDDDKRKKMREIFRKIAAKVLMYHGLPKAYTAAEIAQNSTLETALKAEDGSYGGLQRRIRIEKKLLPPGVFINFYAKVLVTDIKAVNGYIHTLNHPLIPPGSIFESAFLFPDWFSTLTSATQGVHGRHFLDWHYDYNASKPGKPKFEGSPLATLFAPTNVAFLALPPRLKFFLFSPFGHRALNAVLAYHYVPHSLLLTEFQYHEKHEKKSTFEDFSDLVESYLGNDNGNVVAGNEKWMTDDPSFHKELEVPTGFPNHTLKVEIDKTKFLPVEGAVKVSMKVNDVPVKVVDVPARNGAFHVIDKVLVPPHHHHDHHGKDISSQDNWENWEEWLPAWVDLYDA